MVNEEVAEIFDEIDVHISFILKRLNRFQTWLETEERPDLEAGELEDMSGVETPNDYLDFIKRYIRRTRQFFKEWRQSKKV